ncbi:molybdenum cofactor biosynthesis protein MoaE [uncultured Brevundimonas sp.]|uniref:molybdenum cofactor biosynthesis protein MoaE n=1 Tax=uncultured Brevundimonas sp. TaxID=213418 RepID=UPI0030EF8163
MALDVRLATGPLSAPAELERFLADRAGDGAVVAFTGLARGVGKDGSTVESLTLDWYPGMTERSMLDIAEAAAARFPVSDLVVVHRCGDIVPGETIVFVAAAAPHRRVAFETADYLMDRLKTEAAFWKREAGPAGTRWIEPVDEDRAALARWKDETP